ncbi:DUF6082 family protein [Streptomyces scopuliridis]|uniref:DUF6082 family protein n=1 Tax=Streptomyces scopuliridis TaxID=452529 RepID=UPI002DD95209|nr:DUF6082 family protein [Streptomyces scopuliridis]WSB37485.1 DUF6082 family protein [Streptomyces scopuliridis]
MTRNPGQAYAENRKPEYTYERHFGMKTSHSVLIATAVGVVGLALSERQSRRRLALHTEEMHQAHIAELPANPEMQALWMHDGEDTNLLHANRLISFLSVKFRAGLLDRRSLRVQAKWFMERTAGRAYWQKFGGFREDEAIDRTDRTFNAILSDEYHVLADEDVMTA